ncbi:glycosyl hydrolase family 28-related protein [Virgibacillus pantothenticus]|uniref:glycosyl hydrolase family 28-related protein n=1 Tax=Virgibacillus pantothenticus TaxID=1473 RepID=UPI0025AF9757|nr:glycosyl hydrolase family 28-related protein [Virgibacillus pantothenticus]
MLNKNLMVANVLDYGAMGNGVTDDTNAFNEAVNYLRSNGGGVLFIPLNNNSHYLLNDSVRLYDNIVVDSDGATIIKSQSSLNYYTFITLSENKQGYGSGGECITIRNLKFKGSFENKVSVNITLHHAKNVLIENCIFDEAIIGGHAIDLGGCSDVEIINCTFKGMFVQEGREYAEAIQIDHSTAEGVGIDNPDSYDGIGCKNISVRACSFLPIEAKKTSYPAPNPLGSHSRVGNIMHRNIRFNDNYVEDSVSLPVGTPYAAGWLHFYHTNGIEIKGNSFINNKSTSARVLGVYSALTTISTDDLPNPNPEKISYTPKMCKNIVFKNNFIQGFNNKFVGRIIYLQGRNVENVDCFIRNVRINSNEFIDCYDYQTTDVDSSSNIVFADRVRELSIFNNYCNSLRRLLQAYSCVNLSINENKVIKANYIALHLTDCSVVNVSQNYFDEFRVCMYIRGIERIKLLGNSLVGEKGDISAQYGSCIAISKSSNLIIKNNDLLGNTNRLLGVFIYGASIRGIVKDNLVRGYRQGIVISSDSSGIKNDIY